MVMFRRVGRPAFGPLLALGLAASACGGAPHGPPPLPAGIESLDPALAAGIRAAVGHAERNPGDAAAWRQLGGIYFVHGMLEAAESSLDRAVALEENEPRGWYLRAQARYQKGSLEGALADLDRAAALDPAYLPIHWRRGLIQLDRGAPDEAEGQFREAIRLDPKASVGWIGLARAHLARGEEAQAARLLEPLVSADPNDGNVPYALHLLATAYRRAGRTQEAREAMRGAGGAGLRMPDPWLADMGRHRTAFADRLKQAEGLLAHGQADTAIPLLEALRAERPDQAMVLGNLGAAYHMKGDLDRSIDFSKRAIAAQPSYYYAHQTLALATLSSSRAADPEAATALLAEALEHVDKAIELNPSLGNALFIKGLILVRMGRQIEAVDAFKRAWVTGGRKPEWLLEAGKLEWALGRWRDAAVTLEGYLEERPDDAIARYRLATAYLSLDRLDEAERQLDRADGVSPGSRLVREARERLRELRAAR